jgi:hypothetical protein
VLFNKASIEALLKALNKALFASKRCVKACSAKTKLKGLL